MRVQSAATLRKQFEGYRLQGAIARETTITDAGLVAGAGTSLMRMREDRFGRPQLALAEDRERALALYCVAFQRRPPPNFLRHLACASGNWPHDKALANLQTGIARPIDWHFKERNVAIFAWQLFDKAGYLSQVHIYYTPEGEGTSERIGALNEQRIHCTCLLGAAT